MSNRLNFVLITIGICGIFWGVLGSLYDRGYLQTDSDISIQQIAKELKGIREALEEQNRKE